ncbi:MAG TPA: phage tail protein [Vicinamibacterales bacterium]|jgi:phage tail-like protein
MPGKDSRDPYCNYTFRVSWDGRVVAGVTRVSAIKQIVEIVEYREAGDSGATRKLPGRTKFDAITLERGFTRDSEFEAWASQVTGAAGLQQYRKDVRIEVLDSQGRVTVAFVFHRCWPSEYAAVTGLEAGEDCCLIQSLTLQTEGWERDTSIDPR